MLNLADELDQRLTTIFRAIELVSPREYSFCGDPVQVREVALDPPNDESAKDDDPLLMELKYTLYLNCYSRDFDGTVSQSIHDVTYQPDPDFVARLRAANHTRYRWDPGWEVYRLGYDGEAQVKKGERHRSPIAGEYAFAAGPGMRPQVGDIVNLQVLAESERLQQIFYFCFSDELPDQFEGFSTVRFYFNCTPDGAVALVDHFTRELNRCQVPFRLKCLNERANFDRRDAAVLYVAKRYFPITSRIVTDLPEPFWSQLQAGVPLFCKTLAPGIGLAEDPGWNTSFGLHRCTLLAETILDAWKRGEQTVEARMRAFKKRLEANGLHFEQPYLSPGSLDVFQLPDEVGISA